MSIEVIHGDCRDVLKTLHDLDACVCDPPYGLEFMSVAWDSFATPKGAARTPNTWGDHGSKEHPRDASGAARVARNKNIAFQEFCDSWTSELYRALKPGAHIAVFGGTRTFHRMACAIEDAGFEIRDTFCWVYGSGFSKNGLLKNRQNLEWCSCGEADDGAGAGCCPRCGRLRKAFEGFSVTLKPAFEPIILARKPLAAKNVAANVLQYGTGALNIDACRVPPTKEYLDREASVASLRTVASGGSPSGEQRWHTNGGLAQPCSAGRWPANLVHDGSDEVEAAFAAFGKHPGAVSNGRKGVAGLYQDGIGAAPQVASFGDTGTASRFFKECKWNEQETASINASGAGKSFDLQSAHVVSALKVAVAASMPRSELISTSYRAHSMNVTGNDLTEIVILVTATIQSFARKCLSGQLPEKLFLSNDVARCVVQPGPTGTMTITLSLWKSDGFVEAATFASTLSNTEHGEVDSAALRLYYSGKADAADRADSRHPTIKPVALLSWIVKLICPPGGTVVDPFAGSGTTGEACMLNGFNCVLIEREAEHVADIRHRMKRWSGLDTPLFSQTAD